MNKYEKMTDEQLISELRSGNREIMDFIMVKYKSMVRRKARAVFLLGGENDDLIQEGMIGLIKAVRDYDENQGTSFASFAELCVSRQMYSAIEASKRKKHIPLNSYISLYDAGEGEEDNVPLIDTIEPEQENDPEALYFGREYTEAFIDQLMGTDYKTIAELLEKSPKSIDNALQRIRGKAEKMLHQTD